MMTQASSAAPKARIEVLRVTSDHSEMLAEFFRIAWNSTASPETVKAARQEEARSNPAAMGKEVPTFLMVSNGQPIAHVTTIPSRHWLAGQEQVVHWTKGLMVLPEYRNGPVGFILLKEAIRQLGRTFATVVAPPARRLFEGLGFVDLGAVPNHILLLDPVAVARQLDIEALGLGSVPRWVPPAIRVARRTGVDRVGGWLAAAGRGVWAGASSLNARSYHLDRDPATLDPTEVDLLWTRMSARVSVGSVRDGQYVVWRYGRRRPDLYHMVTAHRRGRLAALAAVRVPWSDQESRLQGIRVAILSDLIYDLEEPGAGLAALRGAELVARDIGAHALLGSVTAAPLARLISRRGYLRIPANMHLLMRDPGGEPAISSRMEDWWLTRADGESDGV